MKTIVKLMIAALCTGAFSFANADALQVWKCKANEGATGEAIMAASSAWLVAAKAHPGGEGVEAHHNYSVVSQAGDGEFMFVMILPDFEAWGKFNQAYPDSAVAEADAAWSELATCGGSALWATEQVE